MLFAQTWAIGLPLPDKDAQSAVDGRPLVLTVAAFEQTVIEIRCALSAAMSSG
jgi:two-component system, NtrC family, C4-dicarboxylate transport response regulator DctD